MFDCCRPLAIIVAMLVSTSFVSASEPSRPNVIVIMTDNHGEWTLGCYGNKDIKTPNIDRLAKSGTLFERAFANNAVCSPTRATFLTGLMPCQHGVHCFLRQTPVQMGPDAYSTMKELKTISEILNGNGYTCGLVGKWHLGDNMKSQEGFSYWITKPHGGSAGFYNQKVIENGKLRDEPKYQTDLWTEHAQKFIKQNEKKPFFLFLTYNGPYGLGAAMSEPIKNRHKEFYESSDLPSFPRTKPQPWNHNYGEWVGDVNKMRKYAAEISAIDDGVGSVMQTLENLNLTENTLVIFTADQGLSGGHSGYWGMGDHTRPLTAFDWTMSIPLIFSHPKKIAANNRVSKQVANYDVYPTLMSYLNLQDEIPVLPKRPGRDFSPMLYGKSMEWEEIMYYDFENVRAVRTPMWKYIERYKQKPNELYDLKKDPSELDNLYGNETTAASQKEMKSRLDQFFKKYATPKWDLWNGGGTKSYLLMKEIFAKE